MNKRESDEVRVMYPDEAAEYFERQPEGSYALVDVRMPAEYEEAHIPGAELIPLPILADSLDELNPDAPTIVYCAVGGRSSMAAKLLAHHGFKEVYHLQGGIQGWEEKTASGPVGFHMKFIRGDETPEEIVTIAYLMEEGLKAFHQAVKDKTEDSELAELLGRLVKAEEKHERAVLESIPDKNPDELLKLISVSRGEPAAMEGGIDMGEFMRQNEPFLQTVSGYLELAMVIEAQALDVYLRMARSSSNPVTKSVLLRISEEEKAHLALLGNLLNAKTSIPFTSH